MTSINNQHPYHSLTFSILFFLSITCLSSLSSADDSSFSPSQKTEIEAIIYDYLMKKPEVLPEAIATLKKRIKTQALSKNHEGLYSDSYSYIGGNPSGDVTVIEFIDYNCGYCKRALKTVVDAVADDTEIRVIYKEMPILSPASIFAAKAAMASIKQNRYQEFHTALLSTKEKLDEEKIMEIAASVSIDTKKLATDMKDPAYQEGIDKNKTMARELEIRGTPGFIIGDEVIQGAISVEDIQGYIQKVRDNNKTVSYKFTR